MACSIAKQFFSIEVGSIVADSARTYRVTHQISIDSVLAIDLQTNQTDRLRIETLQLIDPAANTDVAAPSPDRDLSDYSEEKWAEAQRRLTVIKPLLEDPIRTRQDAERLAKTHQVHAATLYRWLKAYQDAGHVSALVPARRGRKQGTLLLKAPIEAIVQSAIEDLYLGKQRHKAQDVIEEVQRRCRLAKLAAPHPNTVRNRIALIPQVTALRRRGRKDQADNQYSAVRGRFPGADYPLAVVQIDHTPTDIIVVDEVYRQPIGGRPHITVAIDVFSRMVVGFYLSLEAPNSTAVALCLSQAMCPKREYLASIGVTGDWPVWGKPAKVFCDNAKEFHSAALERGCREHNIDPVWRPVKKPRYGGHIERLMGIVGEEMRKLPGATFRNPEERKGYDSEAQSAMTLRELEAHFADFLVNKYHQRLHTGIGMSPLRKWELGIMGDASSAGVGLMPIPQDPLRLQLDFMPFFKRTIQRYGIQIDGINYYDPLLDRYINSVDEDHRSVKRKFIIRRDPRNISRVYFFDPLDARYYEIAYLNITHPAMSLWELREVQCKLIEAGRRDIDEDLIFETLERLRARVAEAVHKTKAARRAAQRNPEYHLKTCQPAAGVANASAVQSTRAGHGPTHSAFQDDPFAEPLGPFAEVFLHR